MKKTIKLLLVLLSISLLFAGCGKKNEITADGETKELGMEAAPSPSWAASHTPLEGRYEIATIADNKVFACRYTQDGVVISAQALDSAEDCENYEILDVSEIKSITVDFEGNICLFGTIEEKNALWKIDQNGTVNAIENIEVENLGLFSELKDFYADSNGHYYLWYGMTVPCAEVYEDGEADVYTPLDRIYIKDKDMNTICYDQVPYSYFNELVSLIFDEDGVPLLLAKDEDGYYMRRVRTAEGEEHEAVRIENTELGYMERGSRIALTKEGLLYTRDGALRLYHMSDGSDEKLLELACGGICEEDIIYLGMSGAEIDIIDNYQESEVSEYTRFEIGESEQIQLTLGVMTLQPQMRNVIAAFNRNQNKVRIDPIIYASEYDYDAGYERLKLDIVQEKAPDLISVYGIDYEILAKVGAFSDLYPFMESDLELSKESFVKNVIDAYETEGHLYTVAPTFRLYTMWGGNSLVQGRFGIDMEKMTQLLSEKGGDINSIYGFSADESVLTTMCALQMGKFIDWKAGTCDFTGKEFAQLLEFVKKYEGKPMDSLYKAIRNKDILFTFGLITSVEDYCMESELYGEKIDFIGYPTETGSGSAVLFSGNELAINAGSSYQKEAWEFIKFFLIHGYDGTGFPVLKDQFENALTASLEETVMEEDGMEYTVARRSYTERDVVSIQVFKAEPEDVDAVRILVEKATDKFQYYNEIQNIIEEEAEGYLTEQKNMEEVTSIIQNRVQLYLDERAGK